MTVGLYSELGTFLSSCGTYTYTTTWISVNNNYQPPCSPYDYGGLADFETCVNYGWIVQCKIFNGSEVHHLAKFGPGLTNNGATVSGQYIKGMNVPTNAAYRVELIVQSPCDCYYSGSLNQRTVTTNLYSSGQIAGNVGTLSGPYMYSCN